MLLIKTPCSNSKQGANFDLYQEKFSLYFIILVSDTRYFPMFVSDMLWKGWTLTSGRKFLILRMSLEGS